MNESTGNTEMNGGAGANTHPEGNGAQTAESKLFTQEEVNKIISERLQRERTKAEPSEQERRESDLKARENRLACREYLIENKYSHELLEILDTADVERFKGSVDKLTELFPNIREDLPRFTYAPANGAPINSDPIADAFKPKI